jgi:hypothetical protein
MHRYTSLESIIEEAAVFESVQLKINHIHMLCARMSCQIALASAIAKMAVGFSNQFQLNVPDN